MIDIPAADPWSLGRRTTCRRTSPRPGGGTWARDRHWIDTLEPALIRVGAFSPTKASGCNREATPVCGSGTVPGIFSRNWGPFWRLCKRGLRWDVGPRL